MHKANDESDEINVSEGTSFKGAALLIFQATLLPAQQPATDQKPSTPPPPIILRRSRSCSYYAADRCRLPKILLEPYPCAIRPLVPLWAKPSAPRHNGPSSLLRRIWYIIGDRVTSMRRGLDMAIPPVSTYAATASDDPPYPPLYGFLVAAAWGVSGRSIRGNQGMESLEVPVPLLILETIPPSARGLPKGSSRCIVPL